MSSNSLPQMYAQVTRKSSDRSHSFSPGVIGIPALTHAKCAFFRYFGATPVGCRKFSACAAHTLAIRERNIAMAEESHMVAKCRDRLVTQRHI